MRSILIRSPRKGRALTDRRFAIGIAVLWMLLLYYAVARPSLASKPGRQALKAGFVLHKTR